MAFQSNAQPSNVSSFAGAQQSGNDSWKADAFINLWVPTNNGKRRKLGYIALKASRPSERALIERLQANPNDVEALKQVIELEFNMAEGNEESNFAF